MNKYVMCFLFTIMVLGSQSVNADDIKMYDNYGRYTGVMKETSSSYKMYDSIGRYTGEMKSTSNGYNSSGRYTGSYRK